MNYLRLKFLNYTKKRLLRNCHTNYLARLREIVPTDFKEDKQKNVLLLLTHGSEEMSAVVISNIVTRAGITVRFSSLTGYEPLRLSHRIVVKPNYTIDEALKFEQGFDLIYITSGYKAIDTLCHSKIVGDLLKWQDYHHRYIAIADFSAIVLAFFNIGRGRKIAAHPATEPIIGSHFHHVRRTPFLVDGNIVSIRSPASAARLAFIIIELISGDAVAETISKRLSFPHITLKHKLVKEAAHKRLKGIRLRENKEEWELRYKRTLSKGLNRILALSHVLEGKKSLDSTKSTADKSDENIAKYDTMDTFLDYVQTRLKIKSTDKIINESSTDDKLQISKNIAILEGIKQEYLDLQNEIIQKYSYEKENDKVKKLLADIYNHIIKINAKIEEHLEIMEQIDIEHTPDREDLKIAKELLQNLSKEEQTPEITEAAATMEHKLKLNPEDEIKLPTNENVTIKQIEKNLNRLKQIKNNYLLLQMEIEEKFSHEKSTPKMQNFQHIVSRKLHVVDEKIDEHEQLLKKLKENKPEKKEKE